ncbi:MAG: prolyl oligopeptidase family serine peptidase [Verrucomicrobiota bacterium]|nr:prolyl oligopeptidase family serine peptidase [Verrucomicrobiota bacterium]
MISRVRMDLRAFILYLVLLTPLGWAQQVYLEPPDSAKELFASRPMPRVSLSPDGEHLLDGQHLLIAERYRFRRISELASRVKALAGIRLNPSNNGPALPEYYFRIYLKNIESGKKTLLKTPGAINHRERIIPGDQRRYSLPIWSPDGKNFAFMQYNVAEVLIHVGNAETGAIKSFPKIKLNAAAGRTFQWLPNSKGLLCLTIPAGRGKPPTPAKAPAGPVVQETGPKEAAVLTYPDLLQNEHDEKLFDYYLTAQLTTVDIKTARSRNLGRPSIFGRFDVSPDGRYVLVERVHPPYSYQSPAQFFPRSIEVWDLKAEVKHVSIRPATEDVATGEVPVQPRGHHWRPTGPATIAWIEALDGGDASKEVDYRDRVMLLEAPFNGRPKIITYLEHRYSKIYWGQTRNVALVREYESSRNWYKVWLVDPDNPDIPDRLLWSHSIDERYRHPGYPLMRQLPNGKWAMRVHQQAIYLNGNGSSSEGDRPFLDRLDLVKFEREHLFKCSEDSYEAVVALMAEDGSQFVTRHETAEEHPNYFLRKLNDPERKPLTQFQDPAKSLREVQKKLITYEREDGVMLNCMLHLPPGYDLDNPSPLPTILWAYPRAYTQGKVAGQVANSPHRFSTFAGASPRFLALQGYAVLDQVAMPIVGEADTVNDNFTGQIVDNAKAAIEAVVKMGVCDPSRVGVGGHSYGAFMAVMLLANSDLFQAGVARSGAYNRTLTPFGFQNERRTLWDAPKTYLEMSPLLAVPKIRDPLLLIHGENDKNPATTPEQTKRLFSAIKGNGSKARIVLLPHETHNYQARESIGHTLAEMIQWFDKYVKSRPEKESTTKEP